jgi:hypothetical protein
VFLIPPRGWIRTSLASVIALVVLGLLVGSLVLPKLGVISDGLRRAGGLGTDESGLADMPIREAKLEPHREQVRKMVAGWNDIADAFASIHDARTFGTANPRIQEAATRLQAVEVAIKKLPKLNRAEDAKLIAELGPQTRAAMQRAIDEINRIRGLPSLAAAASALAPVETQIRRGIRTIDSQLQSYAEELLRSQSVTVKFTEVEDKAVGELILRHMKVISPPGISGGTEWNGNSKTITCRFTPIPKPDAFIERIDFAKVRRVANRNYEASASSARFSAAELTEVRREVDAKETADRARRTADEAGRRLRDEHRKIVERIRKLAPRERDARRAELAAELATIAGSEDVFQRGDAVKLLAEFGGPECVPALVAYVERGDMMARSQALDALVRIKHPSAAEPMARSLRKEKIEATRVLIAIGPPAETAVAALLGDQDESIRRQACEILAQIRPTASLPALNRLAGDGPDSLKQPARNAVGAIEGRSAM